MDVPVCFDAPAGRVWAGLVLSDRPSERGRVRSLILGICDVGSLGVAAAAGRNRRARKRRFSFRRGPGPWGLPGLITGPADRRDPDRPGGAGADRLDPLAVLAPDT